MFVCTLFSELGSQGTTDSFKYPQKIPTQIKLPKKILAKFSYPKKTRNRKFQTQKNSLIIPVTWNPEYRPWGPECTAQITSFSIFSGMLCRFVGNAFNRETKSLLPLQTEVLVCLQ